MRRQTGRAQQAGPCLQTLLQHLSGDARHGAQHGPDAARQPLRPAPLLEGVQCCALHDPTSSKAWIDYFPVPTQGIIGPP